MDSERRRQERLSRRRELYRLRMARETPEEREARLIRQLGYRRRRRADKRQQLQVEPSVKPEAEPSFPPFDDPTVIAKLTEFHQHLLSLESAKCSVCLEKFPSVHVDDTSICSRCHKDQHTPKLYSAGNNMDPGQYLLNSW